MGGVRQAGHGDRSCSQSTFGIMEGSIDHGNKALRHEAANVGILRRHVPSIHRISAVYVLAHE